MNINMATNMFVNNAVNFLHNIKIHLQRILYIQVSEQTKFSEQTNMKSSSMHFKSFLGMKNKAFKLSTYLIVCILYPCSSPWYIR